MFATFDYYVKLDKTFFPCYMNHATFERKKKNLKTKTQNKYTQLPIQLETKDKTIKNNFMD